uniref:Uncharacterized protein n=1 Tax=Ascaris lumbricoides TaxID=6252 RepID=A0A0M3ISW4_ASCLU
MLLTLRNILSVLKEKKNNIQCINYMQYMLREDM